MRRFISFCSIFFFLSPCFGLTPVSETHNSQEDIDNEFLNIFSNAQDRRWKVFNATPTNSDVRTAEPFVVSTQAANSSQTVSVGFILNDSTTTIWFITASSKPR